MDILEFLEKFDVFLLSSKDIVLKNASECCDSFAPSWLRFYSDPYEQADFQINISTIVERSRGRKFKLQVIDDIAAVGAASSRFSKKCFNLLYLERDRERELISPSI